MNKIVNIAIVGLGQVGIYLYNELRLKKKEIEIKTGKKINIVAISAKNKKNLHCWCKDLKNLNCQCKKKRCDLKIQQILVVHENRLDSIHSGCI